MIVRKYIGTFTCDLYPKRVRVYEQFPSSVLCTGCAKKVDKHKKAAGKSG